MYRGWQLIDSIKRTPYFLFTRLGKGYSEEYVQNMTAVHQKIRNNRETLIEIIKGPDMLCAKISF